MNPTQIAPGATVAVIGWGNMGGPMAQHWIRHGYAVRGYDQSAAARARIASTGAVAAPSAAEAARGADVTVLMLPDSSAVSAVLADIDAAGALAPAATIVDMGSSAPAETRRHAERYRAAGVGYVDAPVSGGVRGAEAGLLTIMAGGDADALATVAALLAAVGTVHHVGPPGAGHAIKALNNLLSAAHLWLTSEAVLIAGRAGVEPRVALEVFNTSSGRSGSSEVKWPKFILTETYDSGFAARLMLKDARIATDLARAVELPSRLGEEVVRQWAEAVADLGPMADHTEVARWLRRGGAAS